MKTIINLIFFAILLLLLSCNDKSTDYSDNLYFGMGFDTNAIQIYSNKNSLSILDTFTIITNMGIQQYRMKGKLILYGIGFYDSTLFLFSPTAEIFKLHKDTLNVFSFGSYARINIDLYPNREFKQEWNFIASDSIKLLKSGLLNGGIEFRATFIIDSIYLDMDSLYDRPTGPIAIPEKRWYRCRELKEHPEDSTDYFILTRDLQFIWPFNPAASSDYFHIYFKKTR